MREPTYKDSDLCVFLLGAGNSADLDLPVMRAFMDTARKHYFARQLGLTGGGAHHQPTDTLLDAYETLLDFYDQCRASS